MNKLKNKFFFFLLTFILFPSISKAVCPVCTVAVAGGIGLSRWLGIDDTISGIWIGGFIVSLSLWFLGWLKKKKINFPLRDILVLTGFYLLTIVPLYWMKLIGYSCNKLWGIDKVIVGTIFGSFGFGFGVVIDKFCRRKNQNRAYFPFQKVVLPILALVILSIIFYFLTKC